MSWSFSVGPVSGTDFRETARKALVDNTANINQYNPDGLDAATNAVECVSDLVETACVGDLDKLFTASLSGHGNPNHEPVNNMSNDMVCMSVNQFIPPTK